MSLSNSPAHFNPTQIERIFVIQWCVSNTQIKCTVMQTEKALINDRVCVSKMSWKFRIPTIYDFAVIYPWNLVFSQKVAHFLKAWKIFSVDKQNLTAP